MVKKAKKEKKEKKEKKTTKRNKLDKIRSDLVKVRAGYRCEVCGATSRLNSHHIFSRINYTTRYDLENGVCLCVSHHTFNPNFSAHRTPLEFADWIISKRGEKRYYELKVKAKLIRDKDYEKIEKYLGEQALLLKQKQGEDTSKQGDQ